MSGFQKLYPSSKNLNDIRRTPISSINMALTKDSSNDGLQGINQLSQQLSSLNNTVYDLSNVVVQGLDMGNDSDTASTGTGVDSLSSIRGFVSNFRRGEH